MPLILTCLMSLLLCACQLMQPSSTPLPATTTTPSSLPDVSADVWRTIAPGLEDRLYVPGGDVLAQMMALRVDPALYTFRVHYRPGAPLTLSGWRDLLPDAVVIVNANFFAPDYTIQGLLVSDGVVYGRSYLDRGGMLAVQSGSVRVRSNLTEPYQGEALEQAAQAFPMLVQGGRAAYQRARDVARSRRTIIGQDAAGRIILMATPLLGLTLTDLSAYLATTDAGLVNAFNLDGGGSTLLWAAPTAYALPSLDAVPAVIALYPR